MKRLLPAIVIAGYFLIFVLLAGGLGYHWYTHKRAPDQPVAFPHTIHVSRLGLACNFCHVYVEKSRHAGAPYLETCMGCHSQIATEKPEIQKLTGFYEEKKPIEWNRVYALPDHVYFSHKRHVKAGVECTSCHGNVGVMKKVRKVSSLKMGWCVSCHRDRGASIDCAVCHH